MKKTVVSIFFIGALLHGTLLSLNFFKFGQDHFSFQHVTSVNFCSIDMGFGLSFFSHDNNVQQRYKTLYQKFKNNEASILIGFNHNQRLIEILCFLEKDSITPHTLYISHSILKNNSANKLMRLLKDLLCIIKHVDKQDREVCFYLPECAQPLQNSLLKKSERNDSWVCEVSNDEASGCFAKLCAKTLTYAP